MHHTVSPDHTFDSRLLRSARLDPLSLCKASRPRAKIILIETFSCHAARNVKTAFETAGGQEVDRAVAVAVEGSEEFEACAGSDLGVLLLLVPPKGVEVGGFRGVGVGRERDSLRAR